MRPHIISLGCVLFATIGHAQESSNPPSAASAPPSLAGESPKAGSPTGPLVAEAITLPDDPIVPLDELIRLAQTNNPRSVIAREKLEASRQLAAASRAPQGPTLQLTPGLSGNREARDEEVILAQPLDLFGSRRARASIAGADLRRAQADNTWANRALVTEVKGAAVALFAAQETEALELAQVDIAQAFRDAASRRAELGDVPPIQVQRADLELLKLQNDLSNARAERQNRRAALNLLIGQDPATPLRVALPLDEAASVPAQDLTTSNPSGPTESLPAQTLQTSGPAVSASTANAATSSELETRPDILSAQAALDARQAEVNALGRARLPEVELQARRSSFFGHQGSYAVRAVITVPLFDLGILKGERRAALAQTRAQNASVELLRQQAAAQVENARSRLKHSRQNVTRYREQIVPITLDLLRKTQIGYAQGASTYLEVLDAQRSLRQVQSEYLQALVAVQIGENTLEAALKGGLSNNDADAEDATRGMTR